MNLTIVQFAKKYKCTRQAIEYQTKNGGLLVENGMIDEENPANQSYIQMRIKKIGGEFGDLTAMEEDEAEKKRLVEEQREARKQEEKLRRQKLEGEIRLQELKRQKLAGELVPVDMVSMLFSQYSKSVTTAFQNATEKTIVEIGQIKKMTRIEKSDLRKTFVAIINEAVENAATSTEIELQSIVDKVIESRGRGERKLQ